MNESHEDMVETLVEEMAGYVHQILKECKIKAAQKRRSHDGGAVAKGDKTFWSGGYWPNRTYA